MTRRFDQCGEKPARARDGAPDWSSRPLSKEAFIRKVRDCGSRLYRDLPWRNIDDAYGVLVSETMLQQTQVSRVRRYWQRWMDLLPTVDALAAADIATVLDMWQGLGYNRRALSLKRTCEICSAERGGLLPSTADELVTLPGIGPATAAGVVAFAFDKPSVYIETNVRSVFLHELFPGEDAVPDKALVPYVRDTCPQVDVRSWYYALLDYGVDLKARLGNPARRSAHYARQSAFEGSRREKRSVLLKCVLAAEDGMTLEDLKAALDAHEAAAGRAPVDRDIVESIAADLVKDGFFACEEDLFRVRERKDR